MASNPCKGKFFVMIGLLTALAACGGETTSLNLSYEATGVSQPDLVLVIRMDEPLSFVPSFDPESFPGELDTSLLETDLRGCALFQEDLPEGSFGSNTEGLGLQANCINLASYFGNTVFDNRVVIEAEENSRATVEVRENTSHFFILFFYDATVSGGVNQCMQLRAVERVSEAFRIRSSSGFELVSDFDLSLSPPSDTVVRGEASNCFGF